MNEINVCAQLGSIIHLSLLLQGLEKKEKEGNPDIVIGSVFLV